MKKPLFLQPVFKDYIWGGQKLKTDFNKTAAPTPLAESWELCCHKDGESTIINGDNSGLTLSEYLKNNPSAIGEKKSLPVLIKLIDASDRLSIQVHPDDEYAMRVENEQGKTEMWYIVDCEPNAQLIFGFKNEVTREQFENAILTNTLLDLVNIVPVKKGDVFFIKAKTLHAIGKGIIIAEVQQSSNTTYRVYDYLRKDANGNERELHINKALEVTNLKPSLEGINPIGECVKTADGENRVLASCEYFKVNKIDVSGNYLLAFSKTSFSHLLCVQGEIDMLLHNELYKIKKGDSVFVPAQDSECFLNGSAQILLTQCP